MAHMYTCWHGQWKKTLWPPQKAFAGWWAWMISFGLKGRTSRMWSPHLSPHNWLPLCPCLPELFLFILLLFLPLWRNSSLLACFLFHSIFFFNNSCNVWAEKPLENDKASFLPAFVTRFIISFLIVYSSEAPCPNGKKICVVIGAVCFPLAGKNKTLWLGKISRYHRRCELLLLVSSGEGTADICSIMHLWATLFPGTVGLYVSSACQPSSAQIKYKNTYSLNLSCFTFSRWEWEDVGSVATCAWFGGAAGEMRHPVLLLHDCSTTIIQTKGSF